MCHRTTLTAAPRLGQALAGRTKVNKLTHVLAIVGVATALLVGINAGTRAADLTPMAMYGCTVYNYLDLYGNPTELSPNGWAYVFVENEAAARCLVGKELCVSDCRDWIRGKRGVVNGPARKVMGPNALAYRVATYDGVMFPTDLVGDVAWCDSAMMSNDQSAGLRRE